MNVTTLISAYGQYFLRPALHNLGCKSKYKPRTDHFCVKGRSKEFCVSAWSLLGNRWEIFDLGVPHPWLLVTCLIVRRPLLFEFRKECGKFGSGISKILDLCSVVTFPLYLCILIIRFIWGVFVWRWDFFLISLQYICKGKVKGILKHVMMWMMEAQLDTDINNAILKLLPKYSLQF